MKYNNLYLKYSLFKLIKNILIFIYPPKCIICNNVVKNYNELCEDCLSSIEVISENICCNCGDVLTIANYQPEYGNTCVLCATQPPHFCRFISSFYYNNIINKLLSKFKYKDNQELAKNLSKILIFTFAEAELNDVDIIIPMPISYRKLLSRKFNQTSLIAKYLSQYTDILFKDNVLLKSKHTKSQASLNLLERKNNVHNSFCVNKSKLNFIKNKVILLIDDVVTTGNTINEASKTLKMGGAKRVYVLCLARVKGNFKIY